jgi:hypothetical protein
VLPCIDVVLTEVSFFTQATEPTIAELVGFMDSNQFQLYDVAALHGRRRDNRLHAGDLVFARNGSSFMADTQWS